MSTNRVQWSTFPENISRSSLFQEIKTDCCEGEEAQDSEDNGDYLDELIRGAQAIIAEYRTEASTLSNDGSVSGNTSLIPEELSRQVEEILTEEPNTAVADELQNQNLVNTTEPERNNFEQNNGDDDEDDDVVFISSEPIIIPSHVIDLRTPAGNAMTRRRRRMNEIIELDDSVQYITPKRTYNPPPPGPLPRPPPHPNLHVATEAPSGDGFKLTCAVCMDNPTRREPMATVCGHIFCKKCIFQAIKITKKCPLCNKKLSRLMAHRIYL